MVRSSIKVMARYISSGGANLHRSFAFSHRSHDRRNQADHRGFCSVPERKRPRSPEYEIAGFLHREGYRQGWKSGNESVFSELDCRANVDPLDPCRGGRGATNKRPQMDPTSVPLDLSQLDPVITAKTQLVAIL